MTTLTQDQINSFLWELKGFEVQYYNSRMYFTVFENRIEVYYGDTVDTYIFTYWIDYNGNF